MTDNQTTDPTTVGGESNRVQLRRTREKRVDHTHEIPFGERVEVECPDCGTETVVGIYGDHDVSYGDCWEWDCDAFHKFERDRAAEPTAEESSEVVQTTLVTDGGQIVHPSTGYELPEQPDYDRDELKAIDDALVNLFEAASEAGGEYYAIIAASELGAFRAGGRHRAVVDGGGQDE